MLAPVAAHAVTPALRAAAPAVSRCVARVPRAARGRRTIVVGRDGGNWNTVLLQVPQAEEWMIERFGKFSRKARPGLNFAIPFVESVAYKRTLKETTLPIHPQTAITRDNVHVRLDGAVYTRVEDSYKAAYGIEQPDYMIRTLAQSAMRKEVGNLELDQLFLERERLNAGIAAALDETSQHWGIRVFRYEIADITVNSSTQEAMERQSNAERVRRAEVLESEGYRQRLINQSEGDRQSAINNAEGQAESIRLKAKAEADSMRLMAEAQADSTRLAAAATADGLREVAAALREQGGQQAMRQLLAEKYVSELANMAKHSKLVIVPDRPNDIGAVLATAMGIQQHVAAVGSDDDATRVP
uniref:Band 7 domain-containing protein n=1 Tax=Zooxanthella nutricula TaxID=1333877 RepID=A0A6U9TF72_9DINO|mmetsp:Transcript_89053/g.272722  ORF Transcript_89053/g.272722 Transcript_89053/m.272722 type:complete len:357 (+) Transcript_89053:81-1151(+)